MTADEPLSDDALAALAHRAAALPDAPPALVRAALALWPARAPGWREGVRRVLAALTFDSWATPALAAGMRGSAVVDRHLLFSTEGRDIDLRIQPGAAGHWRLSGQVLGPDEVCDIALWSLGSDPALHRASLDSWGEFRIDGVADGDWRLVLQLPGCDVELPPLALGPAAAP